MSDASGDKPPRSGLTPAGWTAISAIAVAVIGAIVTLTTTWWQRPAAPSASKAEVAAVTSTPEPAAKPEAATTVALPDPAQWAGSWIGTFQEGGQRRRIELTITAGCGVGKACGVISVPHVPCKGVISLAEVRPDGAEFSVDRFEAGSAAACQPGAGEVFRETPEGALAYSATYSGAKGVLTRAD